MAETRNMERQFLKAGKAVIPASNRIYRSYTITITIPKIRIKIPKAKVLGNAMRKKFQRIPPEGIKSCRSRSTKRWANPGKFFFPKVTTTMSNVFGSTKRTRNNVFSWNARHHKNRRRGCKRISDAKCDGIEDEYALPLRGFLGLEMKQELYRKIGAAFLNKRSGLDYFKCKFRKVSFGGCSSANGVSNSNRVGKRHPSFPARTIRTPSKMQSTRRGNCVRRERCLTNKVMTKDVDEAEHRVWDEESKEGDNWELCKKRILMGKKCRPLNLSGYLKYDKDGVLIPDVLF